MIPAPLVTVLVPAKDEHRSIRACLDSVRVQDYPLHMIEVLVVVDASCSDGTDLIAKEFLGDLGFARTEVVRGPGGGTPGNLNAGLALAEGEILCRVDARSRIPAHYVRTCVGLLTSRPDVVVSGGAQVAVPSRDDQIGVGIARALNNRWATGWSRYRRSRNSGAADTVYLGAFRTDDLRRVGGWSSHFPTNQDFELNRRLAVDGLVWFDARIPVQYVPRTSIRDLYAQYMRFGHWKVRYWRRTGDRPQPRQIALLVAVPTLAIGVAAATIGFRKTRVAVVLGALGAFVLEARGTSGPEGRLSARASAVVAMGAIGGGWLTGAWRELLRPSGDGCDGG
jgi:succinoglycan biosynthesis protein ExoA